MMPPVSPTIRPLREEPSLKRISTKPPERPVPEELNVRRTTPIPDSGGSRPPDTIQAKREQRCSVFTQGLFARRREEALCLQERPATMLVTGAQATVWRAHDVGLSP